MSRFLPAVMTAHTLKGLGLHPEDIMGRVFGGIKTNSAAKTHSNAPRDLHELDDVVKNGLQRLYDFQHADGGWAWWKDGDSDRWMSAYVVWGLALARESGLTLKADVLSRGAAYLDKTLVEEEQNPDMQAFMLHALAYHGSLEKTPASKFQSKAFQNLFDKRDQLNAYTRALLALSAHYLGKPDEAKTLITNLEDGVKRDNRTDSSVVASTGASNAPAASLLGTAHWGEDGIYWRWSEGGVEATAFALRALLTVDPGNKLIEPVTNWLIKNRRGAQWSSTRDTAIVLLALNDYLKVSGELKPDFEYEVEVNDTVIAKRRISGSDVFDAPSRFEIAPGIVTDSNVIRIRRTSGSGSIYFSAEAKFFSLEEPVTAAGNEIFVKRSYFKLAGRPTLLKGYVYEKVPMKDGDSVKSGERVETVITVEAKNNYEYLVFEDLKPAGFEVVEVRSGESLSARELKSSTIQKKFGPGATNNPASKPAAASAKKSASRAPAVRSRPRPVPAVEDADYTSRSASVYQELRDRKVSLFLARLPEGVWEIRYNCRAEVPGSFHALPVSGYAMYVPEIRANGEEIHVKVAEADRKDN
jgi:uncharacterized protein YfaS (alpha-2-macroglobulin family)